MRIRSFLLTLIAIALTLSQAHAQRTFTIGTAGTSGNVNNWPGNEAPPNAIDSVNGSKYLNFAKLNTGYILTPAGGSSVATGITFVTANDAAERDPASYELYGSNSVTASNVPNATFNVDSSFTLISTGPLALPGNPATDDQRGVTASIGFSNSLAYTTYLLIFPSIKDAPAADSMQIAEARLTGASGNIVGGIIGGGQVTGTAVPEPASLGFITMALLALHRRRTTQ